MGVLKKIPLLDHGYIAFVEGWGSDESIIEAARMSTDKGFLGWGHGWRCSRALCDWRDDGDTERSKYGPCPKCGASEIVKNIGDEKLLGYLYNNNHATPFEMGGMIVEVMAPIFVFREWHRHRTQSYNEMSARYTPLPDLNYIPTVERLMRNSNGANKQAGTVAGAGVLTVEDAEHFRINLADMYAAQEKFYQGALAMGVPKELARIDLPVGRYSKMRASTNLRNWLGFMTLRSAAGAQEEIRVYSQQIAVLLRQRFPRTMELFDAKHQP